MPIDEAGLAWARPRAWGSRPRRPSACPCGRRSSPRSRSRSRRCSRARREQQQAAGDERQHEAGHGGAVVGHRRLAVAPGRRCRRQVARGRWVPVGRAAGRGRLSGRRRRPAAVRLLPAPGGRGPGLGWGCAWGPGAGLPPSSGSGRPARVAGSRRSAPRPPQNSWSIQSIIERSSLPSRSIWWFLPSSRMRWKFSWPALFSAIHSRAKSPDWISAEDLLHRRRGSRRSTRLPRVRSPYSAVFEIE